MIATDFELTQTLVENSPDALIAISVEGNVLFWNPGAQDIFGYSREEAMGHSIIDLVVPDGLLGETQSAIAETLEAGFKVYESVRKRKDGSFVDVAVSKKLVKDAQGNVRFIAVSKKDITLLKVMRDARLIEARFRGVLESVTDAMVIVNREGAIVLINAQAEKLFGYEREDLLGRPVETLIPRDLRGSHVGTRAGYIAEPGVRPMGAGRDLTAERKDGSSFPAGISLSPLETEHVSPVLACV